MHKTITVHTLLPPNEEFTLWKQISADDLVPYGPDVAVEAQIDVSFDTRIHAGERCGLTG